jgi:hypothetical protein
MSETVPRLAGRADVPDTCPECDDPYARTWIQDARPLGTLYRVFHHQGDDAHDQCFVTIDEPANARSVCP